MGTTSLWMGAGVLALAISSTVQAAPSVSISFISAQSGNYYKYDAPFEMAQTCDDAAGIGAGYVNLSTGTLKAIATAKNVPQLTVSVQGVDSYTIHASGSTPISITARLVTDGIGLIPTDGQSMSLHATVGRPGGGGSNSFVRTWQATSVPTQPYHAPINEPFMITAAPAYTTTVTPGVEFDLYYSLRLDTRYYTSLDFSHTASIVFDLPEGVTISSQGAYAVPEPTSLAMILPALALITTRRRHR